MAAASFLPSRLALCVRHWGPTNSTSTMNLFRRHSKQLEETLTMTNDLLEIFIHSLGISRAVMSPTPGSSVDIRLQNTESFLCTADAVNDSVTCLALWTQLLNGALIFETNSDGSFIYKTDPTTGVQKRQRRSGIYIASKISRLAAKTVGSVTALHQARIITLGSHAMLVGGRVSLALHTFASGCSFIEHCIEVHSLLNQTIDPEETSSSQPFIQRAKNLRSAFLAMFCDFLEIISTSLWLIFSIVPAVLGIHALLILGIVTLMVSIFNFIQDIIS
ncbi:hypothetical protein [Candidatus Chlamydia sanziniae]|uniref:Uncharacterized protein n=1 Tax=Candidatus Chlamydia sanziniae TaxID=1806891 RepID=A0A1A9HXB1_9CHLA|nr:hypothetical protein [Candidatus Chlamydia sanziniae]ANH78556.1 hypothetical protein Cs308_0385 [Candidatus Chlamydia sanziniae]